MEQIIDGNLIYTIKQIGNATVKEFFGYVVEPELMPEPPDRISILEQRVQELTVVLGDTILGGI